MVLPELGVKYMYRLAYITTKLQMMYKSRKLSYYTYTIMYVMPMRLTTHTEAVRH